MPRLMQFCQLCGFHGFQDEMILILDENDLSLEGWIHIECQESLELEQMKIEDERWEAIQDYMAEGIKPER